MSNCEYLEIIYEKHHIYIKYILNVSEIRLIFVRENGIHFDYLNKNCVVNSAADNVYTLYILCVCVIKPIIKYE